MTYNAQKASRGLAALAVALTTAVAAAGPANAEAGADLDCSSGCAITQVSDGTSNTLAIAETAHLDQANHRVLVTLRPGQHLPKTRYGELRLSSPYVVLRFQDVMVESLSGGHTESLALNFTKVEFK